MSLFIVSSLLLISSTSGIFVSSGCGQNESRIQTGSNGTITSKNYPSNYDNNLNCFWFINGDGDDIDTILKFNSKFKLQADKDYIKIFRDNCATKSPDLRTLIVKLTGAHQPSDMKITENKVCIYFHSDRDANHTGFQLDWFTAKHRNDDTNSECGEFSFKYHTGESGAIASKYWPKKYSSNSYCKWHITGTENKNIKLSFNSIFGLTEETKTKTCKDLLRVYSGGDKTDGVVINEQICGNKPPSDIFVIGNKAYIEYESTKSQSAGSGFQFVWESTDSTGKTPATRASTTTISPSYKFSLPIWVIAAGAGGVLVVIMLVIVLICCLRKVTEN